MAIEGRVICPADAFVEVCKQMAVTADIFLGACYSLQKDINMAPDENKTLQKMMEATAQVRHVENLLRIILEENEVPIPPNGSAGGTETADAGS